MTAERFSNDCPIWGDLFRQADREWEELLAQAEKDRPELPPGHVWQTRKVKRGNRWVNEMVAVPDPLGQFKKKENNDMRKPTPAGSNPKGRGVALGQVDPHGDQVKQRQRQRFVDILLEPLNRVAKELEEKWGYDRLPGLVPLDMAERFAAAAEKLEAAIESGDTDAIKQRAEVMRRGWLKLDETAEAEGHEPWKQLDVWEGRRPDGKTFLLVKDKAAAVQAHRDKGLGVWTLDEIGRVLQHFDQDGLTQAMKEEFGGELVAINADKPPF